MADYASSGIWVIGAAPPPWRHGMIEHETLGISSVLAHRFDEWIAWYERDHTAGKLDAARFEEEGLSLAGALKRELGSEVYVAFTPEPTDGQPVPSIAIE